MSTTPHPPTDDATLARKARKSARRYLAVRSLHRAHQRALEAGALRFPAEFTLVLDSKLRRSADIAGAELYRDLARYGSPIKVAGKRIRIDTETEAIVIFNA